MILNKKGVTIVELIVSITMLVIISTFLFQIIISLKEVYDTAGIKTEMLNKQAIISKMVNNDLSTKKLQMASKCDLEDKCLAFYFEDGTEKILEFKTDEETNTPYIKYGDYRLNLVNNSYFSSFNIHSEKLEEVNGLTNDSILNITIPIKNRLLNNQDFGINILYQYNSNTTSIADLAITGNIGASRIYLAGAKNMIWYSTVEFEDPGYFYLDENKNLKKDTQTNEYIRVSMGEKTVIDGKETQIITYTSIADPSISETRTVIYVPTEYIYNVNNAYYTFSAPISGTYNVSLWGANGNSSVINGVTYSGGLGAYVTGNIALKANEKLYVYVGAAGFGDNGGYNGGGSVTLNQSSFGGAAGGGATDIRLISGDWDSKDSLLSRIMVAAGGGGASSSDCGYMVKTGGNGGTTNSFPVLNGNNDFVACSDGIWTLAYGATQTSGGILKVSDPVTNNIKSDELIGGLFGMAGTPSEFLSDVKTGGGGGYYGGTNAGYGSFATGGSSFISGCEGCVALDQNGLVTDSNIHYSGKKFTSYEMKNGNDEDVELNPSGNNDGYARIKLVSITYGNQG